MEGAFFYLRLLRGAPPSLTFPLTYPDPAGEFYGYDRWGLPTAERIQCGTRTLLNATTLGAAFLVARHAGVHSHSKRHALEQYGRLVGDEWAAWLRTLYDRCRQRWHYQLPDPVTDRAELSQLCERVLDWENEFLHACYPYLQAERHSPDDAALREATRRLSEVIFPENFDGA